MFRPSRVVYPVLIGGLLSFLVLTACPFLRADAAIKPKAPVPKPMLTGEAARLAEDGSVAGPFGKYKFFNHDSNLIEHQFWIADGKQVILHTFNFFDVSRFYDAKTKTFTFPCSIYNTGGNEDTKSWREVGKGRITWQAGGKKLEEADLEGTFQQTHKITPSHAFVPVTRPVIRIRLGQPEEELILYPMPI